MIATTALSARTLLDRLAGDKRDELQRAMRARDLDAIRALMHEHRDLAAVRVVSAEACLYAPVSTMRPHGWTARESEPRTVSHPFERLAV